MCASGLSAAGQHSIRPPVPFVMNHLITLVLGLAMSGQVAAPANPELGKLVSPDAKIEKLGGGVQFGEGPLWVPADGGYLLFSDVPGKKLKRWDAAKGLVDFKEVNGPNGNTLDAQGRLITCEETGRRLTITEADGTVRALVEKFEDKKLNSPNDVVVRNDGTIWFTDPPYGLRGGAVREQEKNNVFRFDPKTNQLAAVVTDLDRPNGLCFSPDHKKLYVADAGRPRHIKVFEVKDDGTLGPATVFGQTDRGNPDGMKTDEQGNLWIASGGIVIFNSEGKQIGRIEFPEGAANLAFGGADGKTIYVTARTGLYALKTNVKGAGVGK